MADTPDLPRETIRRICLANGFTIKDGLDDLKPYVYAAVEECAREAVRLAARASVPAGVRPEVAAFVLVMESKLRAHDDRPGWKDDAPEPLRMRIYDEWLELTQALRAYPRDTPEYHSRILGEAADVANFAMMIADNWGNLLAAAPTPPDEVTRRSQFEAWAKKDGYSITRGHEPFAAYDSSYTDDAWAAWQAARTQGDRA